jgi:hypothetical protein
VSVDTLVAFKASPLLGLLDGHVEQALRHLRALEHTEGTVGKRQWGSSCPAPSGPGISRSLSRSSMSLTQSRSQSAHGEEGGRGPQLGRTVRDRLLRRGK